MMSRGDALVCVLLAGVIAAATSSSRAEGQQTGVDLTFVKRAGGGRLPQNWHPLTLGSEKPVQFSVENLDGMTVLRADSRDAASALAHSLDVSADHQLSWRWKVDHSLSAANPSRRSGDDFAARVYVLFKLPDDDLDFLSRLQLKLARLAYGQDLPAAALCYVWSSHLPIGSIQDSAYTSRVRVMVLERGDTYAGRWRNESRDLIADYRAAFKSPAPRVAGIAVTSDTDNTHSEATAWFADLRLRPIPKVSSFTIPHSNGSRS